MKVLLAGATGALGTPLTRALIAGGHEILGLTRSPESLNHLTHLGAHPIVANVMDRDGLLRAVQGLQADVVIHALTALKKTPLRHRDMYATDALHDIGTTNLLAAARTVGARRFVAESMTMGYGYGDWSAQVITEDCPFAPAGSSSQLERHVAGFRSLEQQIWEATRAGWIEGISLRYGAFYGPASLSWMMRPLAPYATDFFATSMRVSNAKAARELGWRPVVAPTYRQGICHALEVLDQQNSASSEGSGQQTTHPTSSRLP